MKESQLLGVILLCTALSGCATEVDPAPPAGFVNMDIMAKDTAIPFNKTWFKENFEWSQYSGVYVAPIDTSHFLEASEWDRMERGSQFEIDVQELAVYTQSMFRLAFRNDPAHKYIIAHQAGPGTLVIQIALVQVVPNKLSLEAASMAGGPLFGTVGKVAGAVANSRSQSCVAFEMKLIDGKTGEVAAMFADREAERGSIVNVKNFSWYAHARSIIHEWAEQLVAISNRSPGEVVERAGRFELKPW